MWQTRRERIILRLSTVVLLFAFLIPFGKGTVLAQSAGNCDTAALSKTLAGYATTISSATYEEVKSTADEINTLLSAYINSCSAPTNAQPTANELFTVQATGKINIRSCAGTTCSVV